MNYRVFIDMKNENALYTVSMLSAMLEDGTGNYLDLLTPFVLYSLPKTIDSPISIDAVTEAMREFGFKDFPYKTSEKILNRLCKASGDDRVYVRQLIKRENTGFLQFIMLLTLRHAEPK